MSAPSVYIIVLTYNSRDVARRCLQSLRGLTYPNHHVVVVDNNSRDGIEAMAREEFPEMTVIQTGANRGYTGGNNRGIEYALAQGADYVLIVNPDTSVANLGFIEEMVAYAEAHQDVGIAGPRVFLREAGVVQNTILYPPGLWRNIVQFFRYQLNPGRCQLSGDEVAEAEALNGVCLLIRSDCLRQIGLFDENIFGYIEDADMDHRAHECGWRIVYLPIDSIVHERSPEGLEMTGGVSFLLKRNSVYFLYKIGKRFDAWGYAILSLLLLLARGVATFSFKGFAEYLRFSRRLALAYHRILFGYKLDKSFGPPFAQWQ
jgi:GT2 family glycosyltransferase